MIRSSSFGPTSSQPPAKQPFSFGGASSSTTAAQQPQPTNTFSFGSNSNNNTAASGSTAAPMSSSLFGAKPAAAPSTSTGFSFGQPANQQPQQSNTTGAGGGLFGSSTTQPSGGLFGQPQQQQQQQHQQQQTQQQSQPQQQSTGGLFGGGGVGSGLGASTSLFGQSQPAASTSLNTLAFNQPQQQQQQQQQLQQSPFNKHAYYQKERFNDLPEEARKLVEEMDRMVQSQISLRDEIQPKLIPSSTSASGLAPLGDQVHQLYSALHSAGLTLSSLEASVEHELAHVRRLANGVEADRQDFAVLWELGANYRNSITMGDRPSSSNPGEKYREFLRSYFLRSAQDFASRISVYRETLSSVSRHLASLSSRDAHSPQAISDTIYFQHSHFMSLASQVAALHSEVETLKNDYRAWYAKQFRSARDPFERIADDVGSAL